MKKGLVLILVCLLCIVVPHSKVYASHTFESNYLYDWWGDVDKSVPAFELENVIDGNSMSGINLSSVDDVFVSKDRIFLIDSVESRLNIFDTDFNFLKSIKLIRDKTGGIVVNKTTNEQLMLTNPEGVFYDANKGELYIADTGAGRIIVLDGKDYYLKRIIEKPKNMIGVTQFKPSKLVVNKDGKMSIVIQGSYEGIVEINSDGSFARYFGLNKPRVNLVDFFWKSIATNQQKEKMKKTFAPCFNNIAIDSDGLIYATTYDASAKDMVFRFNAKGENVLLQKGSWDVVGDLMYFFTGDVSQKSKFVDIAVSDYGVYALLDKNKGRVFIYSFEGDLISIFGSIGNIKGNVKDPSGIAWCGNKLLITDKQLGCCSVFQPTEFGETALGAAKQYFNGNWTKAGKLYEDTLALNANSEVAYVGAGRNFLMQDEFDKAMYDFKLGFNRQYYSKAFNGYRNLFIQNHFVVVAILLLMLIFLLFYSEYKYNKKNK